MLAQICRDDCVGLTGERMGGCQLTFSQQQRVGPATSDLRDSCAGCCAVRTVFVGLPPRLRLWAAGRQVGARSTGDQQYCCQPQRRGEADPAQQHAS
jgi:hypothetical protein